MQSTPQEATIKFNETKKFDLDGDGVYDIAVKYNEIVNNIFAKIQIIRISETVEVEVRQAPPAVEEEKAPIEEKVAEAKNNIVEFIKSSAVMAVAIIVVVIILVYLAVAIRRKRAISAIKYRKAK